MVNESGIGAVTSDLPQVGSDLGNFLGNMGPGLVNFIFTLGIAGGIIGIVGGIFYLIQLAVKGAFKK